MPSTDQEQPTPAPSPADRAVEARGYAVVFDACAALFLNEPSEEVVGDVRRVARALGDASIDEALPAEPDYEALKRLFLDRTLVVSSPVYVPLQESCVAGSTVNENGSVHYNGVQSSRGDHALRCYKAVGFDFKAVGGGEFPLKTLRCDSLASELAFLAFMKGNEALAWENGDEHTAGHWHALARRFAREHAGAWFGTAADRLAATSDDLYARACALAAQTAEALAQEE